MSRCGRCLGASIKRPVIRSSVLFLAIAAILTVPIPLEANLIFVDITPSLFVLIVIASVLGWRRYRQRGWSI